MKQILAKAVEQLYGLTLDHIDISRTDEAGFGVYTTNVAFFVGRETGRAPETVASELADQFMLSDHHLIPRPVGGRLNFHLPDEVQLSHYAANGGAVEGGSDYFRYRLKFIQYRLSLKCRKLERIQFFDPRLRAFYIAMILHGKAEPAETALLAFDRDTDYRTLDNYQCNVLYTLVCLAVDKMIQNA